MGLKLRFRKVLLVYRSGRNKSERIRRNVDPTLIKPRNNCAGEEKMGKLTGGQIRMKSDYEQEMSGTSRVKSEGF